METLRGLCSWCQLALGVLNQARSSSLEANMLESLWNRTLWAEGKREDPSTESEQRGGTMRGL